MMKKSNSVSFSVVPGNFFGIRGNFHMEYNIEWKNMMLESIS